MCTYEHGKMEGANTMIFEITKLKAKNKHKTFKIDCDLEYIKCRIDKEKDIALVILQEGVNRSVVFSRLFPDKLLSAAATWHTLAQNRRAE